MAQSDQANSSIDTLTAEISQLRDRIEAQHERLMEVQSFGARQSQFLIWFAGLAVVLLFVIAWRVDGGGSDRAMPYASLVSSGQSGSSMLAMEEGGLKTGTSGLPTPSSSLPEQQQRTNNQGQGGQQQMGGQQGKGQQQMGGQQQQQMGGQGGQQGQQQMGGQQGQQGKGQQQMGGQQGQGGQQQMGRSQQMGQGGHAVQTGR